MIKCFEPTITKDAHTQIHEVLESKLLGFGPKVSEFERNYSAYSKKNFNIGFNSASSAAYVLFQNLFEKCGPCRIYTPALGFISPMWSALKNGHQVVLTDIDDNLLMGPKQVSDRMVKDGMTSVLMPVLYGGVSNIPGLFSFAKDNSFIMVLDSAHCVQPSMDYDYAFYSFHSLKPVCMSSGGLLSTNIRETSEYCRKARNFGRLVSGDTYDIVQNGFNFYMNNLNASLGLASLKDVKKRTAQRRDNFNFLKKHIPRELGVFCNHDSNSSHYLATIILERNYSSKNMREHMKERGIQCAFHYPPLHKTSFYDVGTKLKNIENMNDRIINVPIHENLKKIDLERIVDGCIHYSRSRRQP